MLKFIHTLLAVIVIIVITPQLSFAQGNVVAIVNGQKVYEADLNLAVTELGAELDKLPAEVRRWAVLEYVVETQILASAAIDDKIGSGSIFQARLEYARRRILRDMYSEAITRQVKDVDIKAFYDKEVAAVKTVEEVRLRHILTDSEAAAFEVLKKVKAGGDFRKTAREVSKDPASNWRDGDLGFLTRDKLNDAFAASIDGVRVGLCDRLAQTEFGWHVIFVEERKTPPPPTLADVNDRVREMLAQRELQRIMSELRKKSDIKVLDASINQPSSALNAQVADSAPSKMPEPAVLSEATRKSAVKPAGKARTSPDSKTEEWGSGFFKR